MKPDVVFIGQPVIDEYYQLQHFPVLGGKIQAQFLRSVPGGFMANAASIFSALGGNSTLMCNIGNDDKTDEVIRSVQAYGVNTKHIHIIDGMRNLSPIIYLIDGERLIVIPQQKQTYHLELSESEKNILFNSDCIYSNVQDLKNIPDIEQLIYELKSNGSRIMLDVETSTFNSYEEEKLLFDNASIISFNEYAVEKFTGFAGEKGIDSIRSYVSTTGATALITLGPKGCRVLSPTEAIEIPAIDYEVIDTTGAGDTCNASFLFWLLNGDPSNVRESAQFAMTAASLSVTKFGPRSGAISFQEVLEVMKQVFI